MALAESLDAAFTKVADAIGTGASAYVTAWAQSEVASVAPEPAGINRLALTRDVNIAGTSAPLSVWLMLGAAIVAGAWILKH